MKKNAIRWIALVKFVVVLLYPVLALLTPAPVQAALNLSSCGRINITATPLKDVYKVGTDTKITFSIKSGLAPNAPYYIMLFQYPGTAAKTSTVTSTPVGALPQDLTLPLPSTSDGNYYQVLLQRTDLGTNATVCDLGSIQMVSSGAINCKIQISQKNSANQTCNYASNSCLDRRYVLIDAVLTMGGQPLVNQKVDVSIGDTFGWQQKTTDSVGKIETARFENLSANTNYQVGISLDRWGWNNVTCNPVNFKVNESCLDTQGKPICSQDTTTIDTDQGNGPSTVDMQPRVFELCTQITNTELKGKCDECYGKQGVWTAVGCIQRTPQSIVKTFLEIGLGVGGGICLLMCLAAGFMITTSQGDPKQVSEGREMITSAIIGLLFIIFSVFILQFIGVTIFNIPGFGVAPKP